MVLYVSQVEYRDYVFIFFIYMVEVFYVEGVFFEELVCFLLF